MKFNQPSYHRPLVGSTRQSLVIRCLLQRGMMKFNQPSYHRPLAGSTRQSLVIRCLRLAVSAWGRLEADFHALRREMDPPPEPQGRLPNDFVKIHHAALGCGINPALR